MIRMRKKTEKQSVRVECYLESRKIRQNSEKKNPYVALLYCEPETGKYNRFFVNNKSLIWDKNHKKYKILFCFSSTIGFIVEFRESPGSNSEKRYFKIVKHKKNHLREISAKNAIIQSRKISKKLSKKNRHFRPIPPDIRLEVWHRDQGQCTYCGDKTELEFDHIIPFSWGGSNSTENIQLLCKSCNRKKSSNLVMPIRNKYALTRKIIEGKKIAY